MRNTNKTLRLLCAIVLVTSSIAQAQTSKKSRFAKDEKVEKYVLRPIPSYKQAVYVDLFGIPTGKLHIGYNKVFNKKYYLEGGIRRSIFASKFYLDNTLPEIAEKKDNRYYNKNENNRVSTLIGLHAGVHKALFGNPLTNTITLGLRGDYLIQNSSYTMTSGGSDLFVSKQKAFIAIINPVITLSSKVSRTMQVEFSGFLSYKFVTSGKANIADFDNVKGSTPGFTLEARLKKLF